jgi:hypothetical protein
VPLYRFAVDGSHILKRKEHAVGNTDICIEFICSREFLMSNLAQWMGETPLTGRDKRHPVFHVAEMNLKSLQIAQLVGEIESVQLPCQ